METDYNTCFHEYMCKPSKYSSMLRAFVNLVLVAYLLATGVIFYFSVYGNRICDFTQMHTAGVMTREGRAAEVYDLELFKEGLSKAGMKETSIPFFYPPVGLLLFWPFGYLPFGYAFILWTGISLGAFYALIRALSSDRIYLLCMVSPAIMINIIYGNNGLFISALIGWSLFLSRDNPLLAGVLASVLMYKPNFCFILPFFFLATKNIQSLKAFFSGAGALAIFTLGFGNGRAWEAFFQQLTESAKPEYAGHAKIYTVTSFPHFANTLTGRGDVIMAVQLALALAVAIALVLTWKKLPHTDLWGTCGTKSADPSDTASAGTSPDSSPEMFLYYALIPVGLLIATPYSQIYDLALLNLSFFFYLKHLQLRNNALEPVEYGLLTAVWWVPAVQLPVSWMMMTKIGSMVSVSWCVNIAFAAFIIKRLWYNGASPEKLRE